MADPSGKEWIGIFVALGIVCYGIMFIDNVKARAPVWEYFIDVILALMVSGIATVAWIAYTYVRRYDFPGHDSEEK